MKSFASVERLSEEIAAAEVKYRSILLNKMNLDCDVVRNGREVLDILQKTQYDLLLLDMQIPVMDGLETINHIRKDEDLKNLYVIALTANTMQGDAEKYIKAGCNNYIPKPIDKEIFKTKIDNIFNQDR